MQCHCLALWLLLLLLRLPPRCPGPAWLPLQDVDVLVQMLQAGVTCARVDLTWGEPVALGREWRSRLPSRPPACLPNRCLGWLVGSLILANVWTCCGLAVRSLWACCHSPHLFCSHCRTLGTPLAACSVVTPPTCSAVTAPPPVLGCRCPPHLQGRWSTTGAAWTTWRRP